MGVGTVWSRALVYFGIVEEDEYWDEEAYAAEEELERTYERDRQNVRRLNPRRREREEFDDWSDPEDGGAGVQTAVLRPRGGGPPAAGAPAASPGVHPLRPPRVN